MTPTPYTLSDSGRLVVVDRWRTLTPAEARARADDYTARAARLRELADQAEANEATWRKRIEAEIAKAMSAHPGSERVGDSVIALTTDARGVPAWRIVYGKSVDIPDSKQPLTWVILPRGTVAHAVRGGREALCHAYGYDGWTAATAGMKRCRVCVKRAGGAK